MINPNGVVADHDDDDDDNDADVRPPPSCEWSDLSSDHLFREYNAHLDLSTTNYYPAAAGSIVVSEDNPESSYSNSSSNSSSDDSDLEDEELGAFLMDAFDDFEPRFLADIATCV